MINVLIAGLGGMGKVHAINYNLIENVKVVGFVGPEKDVAEQFELPLFESITEACNNLKIDVVDICTPTYLHKNHVLEAFNNGKHVICEKPMALKVEDAKEMFNVANKKGLLLFIAHVVQFTQETSFLREILNNGIYGKVIDAFFSRLSSIPKWANKWMFDRNKGGLIPYDLHIHDLDLIISLFGKPESYELYKAQGVSDFPEYFKFIYRYSDKNIFAEGAWFNANIPFNATWRVVFEKAVVHFDGKYVNIYPDSGEPIIKEFKPEISLKTGINVGETDMFYRELKHFVNCIEIKKPSPLLSEQQIINTLEVLEEIDKQY